MKHLTLTLAFAFIIALTQAQQQAPPPNTVGQPHQPVMAAPQNGQGHSQPGMLAPPPHRGPFSNANLSYNIIETPNHTFGFALLADGKMIFQQTMLGQPMGVPAAKSSALQPPAARGMQPFRTREEATKAAQLSLEKVRRGEMPPMITSEDLQHLAVAK